MGHAPYAKLVYGYDLDEVARDFTTHAEKRLLESAGFAETDWRADGYHARKRAAEADVGVTFEYYGGEPFAVALVAEVIKVDWGIVPVDLPALASRPVIRDWDAKLAAAVEALDITPTQERPGWLLCAYYG